MMGAKHTSAPRRDASREAATTAGVAHTISAAILVIVLNLWGAKACNDERGLYRQSCEMERRRSSGSSCGELAASL